MYTLSIYCNKKNFEFYARIKDFINTYSDLLKADLLFYDLENGIDNPTNILSFYKDIQGFENSFKIGVDCDADYNLYSGIGKVNTPFINPPVVFENKIPFIDRYILSQKSPNINIGVWAGNIDAGVVINRIMKSDFVEEAYRFNFVPILSLEDLFRSFDKLTCFLITKNDYINFLLAIYAMNLNIPVVSVIGIQFSLFSCPTLRSFVDDLISSGRDRAKIFSLQTQQNRLGDALKWDMRTINHLMLILK